MAHCAGDDADDVALTLNAVDEVLAPAAEPDDGCVDHAAFLWNECPGYSNRMPASLMTFPQTLRSCITSAVSASGELLSGSTPSCISRSRTSCAVSAVASSLLRRAIAAFGVLAGTKTPYHDAAPK